MSDRDRIWTAKTAMALADRAAAHPDEWQEYRELREWLRTRIGFGQAPAETNRYYRLARLFLC